MFERWGGWIYEGQCEFRASDIARTGELSLLMVAGQIASGNYDPKNPPPLYEMQCNFCHRYERETEGMPYINNATWNPTTGDRTPSQRPGGRTCGRDSDHSE